MIDYQDIYDATWPTLRCSEEFFSFSVLNFMARNERIGDAESDAIDHLVQSILDKDIEHLSEALPLAYRLMQSQ